MSDHGPTGVEPEDAVAPEGEGTQLPMHPCLGSVVGGPGSGCLVLFGLPFVAVGVVAAGAGLGMAPGTVHVSESAGPLGLALFGALFLGAGLLVSGMGLRAIVHDRLIARRAAESSYDEPWQTDARWDPREGRDRASRPLGAFLLALGLLGFMLPFNYFALYGHDRPPAFALGIIACFDLMPLLALGHSVYLLLRRLKYGDARVRWPEVPVPRGSPTRLVLQLPRALRGWTSFDATLRLIEERRVTRKTKDGQSTSLEAFERWAQRRTFTPADVDGAQAVFEVTPPATAPATELSASPPRYWELQVDAETPGVDWHGRFLIPVY